MSGSGTFCPRCGETVEERGAGPTARDRALCTDCYLEEYDLVDAPDRVEVQVCAQCGAVRRGNSWVDVGAQDYTDVAVDAVREALGVHVDATAVSWEVAPEQVDETTIRMHCGFTGELRGRPLAEEVTVPVKLGRGTCDRCGRIAGGSYASVVQVRATDRTPDRDERDSATELAHELVEQHEADGDRQAFVAEIGDVAGGLDIKLSTTQLGDQLARRLVETLGGSYTDHETLVTEDEDGNGVYRLTYAVRLPPYRPGDIIDPADGDGPVLVRAAHHHLTGLRLHTGDPYETAFDDDDLPDARRLGQRGDATETTVVAVEDDHAVQLLDPESFEAVTVVRPPFFDPGADTVPVLRADGQVHILPEIDDGSTQTAP
jgi:NMD protein affecting ribosome stability and mRNA decay